MRATLGLTVAVAALLTGGVGGAVSGLTLGAEAANEDLVADATAFDGRLYADPESGCIELPEDREESLRFHPHRDDGDPTPRIDNGEDAERANVGGRLGAEEFSHEAPHWGGGSWPVCEDSAARTVVIDGEMRVVDPGKQ